MGLIPLKQWLRARGQANILEIAHHCQVDVLQARHMLKHWMQKGVITERGNTTGCQTSCHSCDPLLTEVYYYVEQHIHANTH